MLNEPPLQPLVPIAVLFLAHTRFCCAPRTSAVYRNPLSRPFRIPRIIFGVSIAIIRRLVLVGIPATNEAFGALFAAGIVSLSDFYLGFPVHFNFSVAPEFLFSGESLVSDKCSLLPALFCEIPHAIPATMKISQGRPGYRYYFRWAVSGRMSKHCLHFPYARVALFFAVYYSTYSFVVYKLGIGLFLSFVLESYIGSSEVRIVAPFRRGCRWRD